MSRSRRKPFYTWTGTRSSKEDKKLAHRGERRKQNRVLQQAHDFDRFLLPHKRECTWNDDLGWNRDGGKWLHDPPAADADPWLVRFYRRLKRK